MSAVGMLAPFLESLFYQAFQGFGLQFSNLPIGPTSHDRWGRPAQDQWDCHFVWKNGKRSQDLVGGIMQLSDAIELTIFLPADTKQILEVLFAYRNKMFHCGFEWPLEERKRFEQRIARSNWPPSWISKATSGGEPWVFYLTDEFIKLCLTFIKAVVEGIGKYCNQKLFKKVVTK